MAHLDLDGSTEHITAATEALLARYDPATTDATTFRGAQFDAGLAWVHFPAGAGGQARV